MPPNSLISAYLQETSDEFLGPDLLDDFYGKGFSQYYRSAPRLLADLAEAGLTLTGRQAADATQSVPE